MTETRDGEENTPGEPQSQLGARTVELRECTHCEHTVVKVEPSAVLECHGEPMQQAPDATTTVELSAVTTMLARNHPVPEPGVEMLLFHLTEGLRSVTETASRLGHEPDVVRERLDRLVEAGTLERTQLPREAGDTVNVYYAERPAPATLGELCVWAGIAGDVAASPIEILRSVEGTLPEAFRANFCI